VARDSFVSEPRAIATGLSDLLRSDIDPVATALGSDKGLWVAAERLNQLRAVYQDAELHPEIGPPPSYAARHGLLKTLSLRFCEAGWMRLVR
jgi:hypothetical protein